MLRKPYVQMTNLTSCILFYGINYVLFRVFILVDFAVFIHAEVHWMVSKLWTFILNVHSLISISRFWMYNLNATISSFFMYISNENPVCTLFNGCVDFRSINKTLTTWENSKTSNPCNHSLYFIEVFANSEASDRLPLIYLDWLRHLNE